MTFGRYQVLSGQPLMNPGLAGWRLNCDEEKLVNFVGSNKSCMNN